MTVRAVFFVSDGTGITAETIGNSLLTQFSGVVFERRRLAFIDSLERADEMIALIQRTGQRLESRPIVVSTVVDAAIRNRLSDSGALILDVFEPFMAPLEAEFGTPRQPKVGQAHALLDFDAYEQRMDATNYALTHDDGVDLDYGEADIILVGVSRSGKTPTCVYLALHYSLKAANYPLTPEDLEGERLPAKLRAHRRKLFGLTIDPERLSHIRNERKPGSRYATLEVCRREVNNAEQMFRVEGIPVLSTTHTSIEEIASKVMAQLGIERDLY